MYTPEIYRVLRRAILKYPLTARESQIFEAWQEGSAKDAVFERTGPAGSFGIVSAYVRTCKSMSDLREAFNAVYGAFDVPPIGERRIVSDLVDDEEFASVETSTGEAIPAHYELRELDDIIPSHSPRSQFRKRQDYPENVQERPYHNDPGEQDKVRRNAQNLKGRFLINDTPDAMSGPPVISASGVVLGGNSRTMSMQMAQEVFPEKMEAYKTMLENRASNFGFTKEQVQGMQMPILVRVVDQPLDQEEMAIASRAFNESTTQQLQADAEAVSKSKLLSSNTMKTIAEDIEPFDSLRKFLGNEASRDFVDGLKKDGVIEKTQESRITGPDGMLNKEGKELVERTLRGAIIQDYDVIKKSGPDELKKIDMALSSLVQMKVKPGWDLSGTLEAALRQMSIFKNSWGENSKSKFGKWQNNLGSWFSSGSLTSDPEKGNKAMQILAMNIARGTGEEFAARLELMCDDSHNTSKMGGALLFAGAGPDPEKSFRKAFLTSIAFVGSKSLIPFKPETNEHHAAIQWAYDHDCKTASEACTKCERILKSKESTPEDIAEAQRYGRVLYGEEGRIYVYPSKIPSKFTLQPGEKLTFIPQKKNDNEAA